MKRTLLAAAAALALGFAGTAHAATLLQLTGGTSFTTPASNNVIGAGATLLDNALLTTTANGVVLQFYFWGSESGFNNKLTTNPGVSPGGSHTEVDNKPYPPPSPTA